ncbi:MAG: hypothetical protein HIU91_13115 [Acidobacteria bacterium]|nr:hypothetical protein [Acidobacteriota bacterium]
MDTGASMVAIDQERVREILARFVLPEEIERFDTRFGLDHTGDPAVFITFHVKDEAKIGREEIRRLSSLLSEITSALVNGGIGGFAYTRLEQAA